MRKGVSVKAINGKVVIIYNKVWIALTVREVRKLADELYEVMKGLTYGISKNDNKSRTSSEGNSYQTCKNGQTNVHKLSKSINRSTYTRKSKKGIDKEKVTIYMKRQE